VRAGVKRASPNPSSRGLTLALALFLAVAQAQALTLALALTLTLTRPQRWDARGARGVGACARAATLRRSSGG